MGVLGALAFSPEQLELELKWIDEHVDGKPYGVDVVMPVKSRSRGRRRRDDLGRSSQDDDPQEHWRLRREGARRARRAAAARRRRCRVERRLGAGVLGWTDATGAPQIDIALAHPIALLANALGPPPKDIVDAGPRAGIRWPRSSAAPSRRVKHVQQGVDIIVAQGTEAGGHTGEIATMVLVPEVVDAVAPVPVLAAGGIGTGRQMAAAMALGADGVWTGSIWLDDAESDTPPVVIEKLLAATSRDTVRSRSLTGKPARQLRTAWTDAWERADRRARCRCRCSSCSTRTRRAGSGAIAAHASSSACPVGQIVSRMNQVRTTKQVVFEMVEEYIDTFEKMARRPRR